MRNVKEAYGYGASSYDATPGEQTLHEWDVLDGFAVFV